MVRKRVRKMNNRRQPRQLFVRSLSRGASRGFLDLGFTRIPCALGRSGIRAIKREGDGATPLGQYCVLVFYFRADRTARPDTPISVAALNPTDGWCDASTDRNYNRPVQHAYPASAERLWRTDRLYDVIGVMDYNIAPRCRGRGSAIFLHIAHPEYRPTEGCIAVSARDMKRLLDLLGPKTKICI